MKLILVAVYLILTITGLILMKLGGNSGSVAIKNNDISFIINAVSGLGLLCYIGSFLLFTKIVVIFDLSYILPICTGIVQIATLIAAFVVFKENFTWQSIVGATLIIIGIIIMNIKGN